MVYYLTIMTIRTEYSVYLRIQSKYKKIRTRNNSVSGNVSRSDIYIYIYIYVYKRKNSLEGSLERVLFAAEPELPKMLVPGLPQISSNVNICARKLKQLCSECDQLHGALIYPHFIGLILICFLLIIPAVNYVINGFFSSRTTLRVITIMDLHNGGKKLLQLLLKIDS